jgi:hypothetical protein
MKVFLSDLHLGDGKERDDFQFHREFEDLVRKLAREFKKIEMIILGDIFDLIRTQKYYEFDGLPQWVIFFRFFSGFLLEFIPYLSIRPDHGIRGRNDIFRGCLEYFLREKKPQSSADCPLSAPSP